MCSLLNTKGLTLLEVLISLLVTTIGVLGLAPLIVLSIDGNTISRDVLDATSLAKDKLSYFESLDSLPDLPYQEQEANLGGSGYYRQTVITNNPSDTTLPTGMCYLTVTISWTDKTGESRSTAYSTILDKG